MSSSRTLPIPYKRLSEILKTGLRQAEISPQEWEQKLSAEKQHALVAEIIGNAPVKTLPAAPQGIEPIDVLSYDLEEIITDYLFPDDYSETKTENLVVDEDNLALLSELPVDLIKKSHYQESLTFFENVATLTQRMQAKIEQEASLAAHYVAMDEFDKVEQLIRQNDTIRDCIVEVIDENGNPIKGNLLRIAALTGNVNPRELKPDEPDDGLFEKLANYYSAKERAEAVNPEGWQEETNRRMQPYRDAVNVFMQKVIEAKATTYAELERELDDDINAFKNILKNKPNAAIENGNVFDLEVIVDALELLDSKITDLGGWADKADLFCIIAVGNLQDKASMCDKRAIKKGLGNIDNGQLPDRAMKLEGFNSFSRATSDGRLLSLGSNFFWGLFETACSRVGGLDLDWIFVGAMALLVSKFMSNKNDRCAELYAAARQTIELEVRNTVSSYNKA
jgi:hypothetical protein